MKELTIAYSDDYLNWRLGSGDGSHPTNPIRAKLAVDLLKEELEGVVDFEIIEPVYKRRDRKSIESIHSARYVSEVIDEGISYDWYGVDKLNGTTAAQMFAGTARLVEKMLAGETRIGFNPQGAKHHAQKDYSSGFCVFNDMAWAALEFKKAGLKVAYIDWDAHAGDGVQNLLAHTDIPTFSIHGHGIFPNAQNTSKRGADSDNYLFSNLEENWYNYNLQSGEGDEAFAWAIDDIDEKLAEYKPDVILLATGADAHEGEYWGLKFTYEGYAYAAQKVAEWANLYSEGRVLIGGAGGYQPHTHTPRIWANVVEDITNYTTGDVR
jgi:acetoin utilization deacetylase AcuC-like enzyme